jgi:hypothetical protein
MGQYVVQRSLNRRFCVIEKNEHTNALRDPGGDETLENADEDVRAPSGWPETTRRNRMISSGSPRYFSRSSFVDGFPLALAFYP